jgi:hypothetical protein
MIRNKDRSGYIGASDTHFVMGNWDTTTFLEWWQVKLGTKTNNFQNKYTLAGTHTEHKIARWYEERFGLKLKLDRQIKLRKLRLRINLDAETKVKIVEIKTHKLVEKQWKLPTNYWQQVQVQMWGSKKHSGEILAYAMTEEDYDNYFLEIIESRIDIIDVAYDENWVVNNYLPRLQYLCWCLKKRKTPSEKEYKWREYENN